MIVDVCNILVILYLSLATASISITITKSSIFKKFRLWVKEKNLFFGNLLRCNYCFSHWVAFGLVAIYQPRLINNIYLIDLLLSSFVIITISFLIEELMLYSLYSLINNFKTKIEKE